MSTVQLAVLLVFNETPSATLADITCASGLQPVEAAQVHTCMYVCMYVCAVCIHDRDCGLVLACLCARKHVEIHTIVRAQACSDTCTRARDGDTRTTVPSTATAKNETCLNAYAWRTYHLLFCSAQSHKYARVHTNMHTYSHTHGVVHAHKDAVAAAVLTKNRAAAAVRPLPRRVARASARNRPRCVRGDACALCVNVCIYVFIFCIVCMSVHVLVHLNACIIVCVCVCVCMCIGKTLARMPCPCDFPSCCGT
jgi:hypothetical protein